MVARATALVAPVLTGSVLLASCANVTVLTVSHAGDTDGVTPTTIRVGAMGSFSGFAASSFAPVATGAAVYFDRVNAAGGVNGRKIVYSPVVDDGTSPSGDTAAAQRLVQSRVFAVVGVGTPFFTGSSILRSQAVPTFGIQENTNAQWSGPAMFGAGGSYIASSLPMPQVAYVAQQTHRRTAAVLAYNVAQSSGGCVAVVKGLAKYHIATPVVDFSIPYGAASLDADVTRMQQNGVDFVATCMDSTGNIKLSQTLQQHGMGATVQYWLDGYDRRILDNNDRPSRACTSSCSRRPSRSRRSTPASTRASTPSTPRSALRARHDAVGHGARRMGQCRPLRAGAARHRQRRDPDRAGAGHQPADGVHRRRGLPAGQLGDRPHRRQRPGLHDVRPGQGTGSSRSSPPRPACTRATTRPAGPDVGHRHDAAPATRGAGQVTQFLDYAVPGVPFGCVFALMAVGLVLTYKASGVFNLAFGAQAFVSALAYVSLIQDDWPRWAAGVIAVLVIGPFVGVLLDRLLFRRIRTASPLVKLVPSLGLLVALPQVALIIAGSEPEIPPPAIVGDAQRVYLHLGSVPISGLELSISACTVLVVGVLVVLFRFTPVGLEMRAVVESPRMTELAGVNAGRVSAFAWILSSMMAALAGVLLSPLYSQLDPQNFTVLLVWGIAGAVIGRFSSLPLALVGGLALGVAQQVVAGYMPAGVIANGLRPSLPFVVLLVFLPIARQRQLDDPLSACDPPSSAVERTTSASARRPRWPPPTGRCAVSDCGTSA